MIAPATQKIGIIGAGVIGDFHAEALKAMPGAELVAAYARKEEKANAFAQQHGCVGYSDLDASKYKFAFIHEESIRYKIDATTETLCPLNIKAGVLYDDIRWTLQSSDYTMVACDPKFWKNPVR